MPRTIALILASGMLSPGAQPPPDLLRKIAQVESDTAKMRANYTYRQSVVIQELNHRDLVDGEYKEVRDITFSPNGARYEKPLAKAVNTLTQIRLTPEDFADIRTIQPFFLTPDNVWLYAGQYKGEDTVDGTPCFLEHVAPKQILAGQRYFEGLLWVRESDYAVLRSDGQAVPQIETRRQQNLFPHFTTSWGQVDGKWLFPQQTLADDTLFFKQWPLRIKVSIRYENYKKFGVTSTLEFGGQAAPQSHRAD